MSASVGALGLGGSHQFGGWPPKCPERIASLADLPDAPLIPYDNVDVLKRLAYPEDGLHPEVYAFKAGNWEHYLEGLEDVAFCLRKGLATLFGSFYFRKVTAEGLVLDMGLHSHRVVTTAGVNKLVDGMHGGDPTTFGNFKYHGIGTGTTAESSGQTDLVTPVSADLVTPGQRAAGNQTEGASANIYRTAAVVTVGLVASALSITEEGIFSAQSVGSGTMLDRTVHSGSPVSLDDNQSGQSTYDLTIAAGG